MSFHEKGIPLISVILPCYNASAFLGEAITSLLNQTYRNIEILAIDDGSTDDTAEIIKQFSVKDSRVLCLKNEKNMGLIKSLNKGVTIAKGEYIARMDADDIAMPQRFEKQLKVLEANPSYDVLSSGCEIIGADGNHISTQKPKALSSIACLFTSFLCTPLLHPAVIGKATVFKKHKYLFAEHTLHVEDYHLWTKMLMKGIYLANQADILIKKRIFDQSISVNFEDLQKRNFTKCAKEHTENYFQLTMRYKPHQILVNRLPEIFDFEDIKEALDILKKLKKEFLAINPSIDSVAVKEIHKIYDEQRIDILIQTLKKSDYTGKFCAFIYLLRHIRIFFSRSIVVYLREKL